MTDSAIRSSSVSSMIVLRSNESSMVKMSCEKLSDNLTDMKTANQRDYCRYACPKVKYFM